MKPCPYCAEEIQDAAVVCKHCGRDLKGGASQVQLVQPKQRTGCVAGGCAVALLILAMAWCMGSTARQTMSTTKTTAARGTPGPTPTPQSDAVRDVEIKATCHKGGFGTVALWDVSLVNKSRTETYRDLRYRTMYESESGNRLLTNRGTFQIALKPGEHRALHDFNDGAIPQQTTKCGMVLFASDLGGS